MLRCTAYWSLCSSDPITWGIITLSAATWSFLWCIWCCKCVKFKYQNVHISTAVVVWSTCIQNCAKYAKSRRNRSTFLMVEFLFRHKLCVDVCLNLCAVGARGHQELEPLTEPESLKGDDRNLRLVALLTPRWFEWSGQLRAVMSLSRRRSQTAPTHRHADAHTKVMTYFSTQRGLGLAFKLKLSVAGGES